MPSFYRPKAKQPKAYPTAANEQGSSTKSSNIYENELSSNKRPQGLFTNRPQEKEFVCGMPLNSTKERNSKPPSSQSQSLEETSLRSSWNFCHWHDHENDYMSNDNMDDDDSLYHVLEGGVEGNMLDVSDSSRRLSLRDILEKDELTLFDKMP
eukprot:CAMPEP_0183716452 /NCGR_PEP_ID=MMETSP0737-20130205/10371_1 /TAXON_ID=385413 /ORGANISM="Thalassiosira miniscula, Strain CCMP1093" /LENGTH=152 /DNA_ID=CAMNT_0025945729 /DNA_START=125 /DNA_END=583 /DNA_ORIENTATION=-